MKVFTCKIAQGGFYAGTAFNVKPAGKDLEKFNSDPEAEAEKFFNAKDLLKNRIMNTESSPKNMEIRNTVLGFLEDEIFDGKILSGIKESGFSASYSILKTADDICRDLAGKDNEYIRARRDDVFGVAEKLSSIIEGNETTPETRTALCAFEISPAQLSSINDDLIGALLTEKGSPNSHASILAGNLEIPYLYGSKEMITEVLNAEFVIIDGESGTVICDPPAGERLAALEKMNKKSAGRKNRSQKDIIEPDEFIKCRTKICANITGPGDIPTVLGSGADGIGLFRTEYLFMDSITAPTEDEQLKAYQSILEAMGGKEVTIRTMDIGSDKKPSWMELPDESNPALGLRGIRTSFENKELFITQIRALLRAAAAGSLKIMLPMITSEWEIDEAKKIIGDTAKQLENEGIRHSVPPLGIMIETPAAAMISDHLAEGVDFFSIGTNDLTQYSLALDREASGLDRYFRPYHEAIFRLIEMTVRNGHKNGVMTAVCGRLAADPKAIGRLISIGVDELSVPACKVTETRKLAAKAETENYN